jgi:predicted nuclease with TOPRIM domain
MSDMKMSSEMIRYALQQLAGFDSSDIECDDFDIAVNDDQFASMSIVRLAELAYENQDELERENRAFNATVNKLLNENFNENEDNKRLAEENAELREILKKLIGNGIDLLNVDDVEDEEDAASIHAKFNDVVNEAGALLAKKPS